MIDFIKATLVTGEPILINEFKINCVWLEKSKNGKEVCFISLEGEEKIEINPNLFYNWVKRSESEKYEKK